MVSATRLEKADRRTANAHTQRSVVRQLRPPRFATTTPTENRSPDSKGVGQMAGTLSPFGSPLAYPGQQTAWGFSPYGAQSIGMSPWLQNIPPAVHLVPQQLQQLHYLQHQQLQTIQQLLQIVPQQLQQ